MDALDGNAIAGQLHEVFSSDMTTATGTCATCGNATIVAELVVYLEAPGTVVRCPVCGHVMMVFVRRQAMTCVDLTGLAHLAA
jgi:ribosomal protein S27E